VVTRGGPSWPPPFSLSLLRLRVGSSPALRGSRACTPRASSGMLQLLEWPHRARSAAVRRPNRYARGCCTGSLARSGIECACAAGAGPIGSSAEAERARAAARAPGSNGKNNPPRLSRQQQRRRRPSLRLRPPPPGRAHPKCSHTRGPTPALVAAAKIIEGRGGAGSSVAKAARRCYAAGVATTVSPCPAIRGPARRDFEGTPRSAGVSPVAGGERIMMPSLQFLGATGTVASGSSRAGPPAGSSCGGAAPSRPGTGRSRSSGARRSPRARTSSRLGEDAGTALRLPRAGHPEQNARAAHPRRQSDGHAILAAPRFVWPDRLWVAK